MAQFSFITPLDKDALIQAMVAVDQKAWEKKEAKEPHSGGEKPDLGAYKKKYETLNPEQALFSYATGGTAQSAAQLDVAQAKAIGAVLLQIEKTGAKRPDVTSLGSDGKTYALEPKELSAYLQSIAAPVGHAADVSVAVKPVNEWAKEKNIGLTGHGDTLQNGNEKFLIETRNGQSRCVANGVITKPLNGYYGGIDEVKVGDGDLLDMYISNKIYDDVKAGKPYAGNVFVMQQMDKGKNDELKVGYAKDVNEFAAMQASTWDKPEDFVKNNQGKYVELTHEQYVHLKAAIAKKPDIALEAFVAQEGLKMSDVERVPTAPAAPAQNAGPTVKAHDDDKLIDYVLNDKKYHGNLSRGDHTADESLKVPNKILEESLNRVNGTTMAEDGKFGKGDFDAVIKFQGNHSLNKDGIVGFQTVTAIQVAEVNTMLTALHQQKTLSEADKKELNSELQDVQKLVMSGRPIAESTQKDINAMLDNLKDQSNDAVLGTTIQGIRSKVAPPSK